MPLLSQNGSLYCGTYQFAYRLIRQIRHADGVYDEVYSDWTIPTAPVYIYDKIDSLSAGDGKIFRQTDNRIQLTINPSTEEKAFYTHYEVAVMRRLDDAYAPPTEAFKYDAIEFPSTWPAVFEVSSNYEFQQIPIEDIVIDKAAIASVNTLAIKNSILFGGNVEYSPLDVATTIAKDSCETIKEDIGLPYNPNSALKGYTDAAISHKYVGYFRDEVYRFAISYVDKYGNWSPAKILDFSGATNNSTEDASAIDWRFPSRSNQNYTIFNENGNLEAIGLRIADIDNHPEWAIGFTILRAKRRKGILFQTPLISTRHIQPPRVSREVSANYPQAEVEVADYSGTLAPKSMFFPLTRHIKSNENNLTSWTSGECSYKYLADDDPEAKVFFTFPPEQMYRNNSGLSVSTYTEGEIQTLEIIDAAGLRMNRTEFGESTLYNPGGHKGTNGTATFYASLGWQYYYERGAAKTDLTSLTQYDLGALRVREYGFIENTESKYTLRTTVDDLVAPSFGGYEDVQDSQATDVPPTNVRGAVIVLNKGLIDPSFLAFDSITTAVSSDISFDDAGTPKQIPVGLISDQYGQDFHSDETNLVAAVLIANVLSGLGDTRYGDEREYNEFIPTNFSVAGSDVQSTYMFSETEIASVQAGASVPFTADVWGGDCYISRHNFKIATSTFHLSYAATDDEATKRWGAECALADPVQSSGNSNNYDRPVALRGASQIVQVYLESEINSDAHDRDAVLSGGSSFELMEGGEFEIPTPLNYYYIMSYSAGNAIKLFQSDFILTRDSNIFPARIVYSNTRLIGGSEDGFDLFNAGDYYDLDGEYGGITKLINFRGRIYSIQDRGFAYVPVQASVIETEDASALSISSGQMISNPQYLSTEIGCSHIKSAISTDDSIVFADVSNKTLVRYNGSDFSKIGDLEASTYFDEKFSVAIDDSDLYSFYDFNTMKLFVVNRDRVNGFGVIRDDFFNVWSSQIYVSSLLNPMEMFYINGNSYVIGKNTDGSISIESMFTNDDSAWFGTNIVPFVEYVVNPNMSIASTFDSVMIDADQKLDYFSMDVTRDDESVSYGTGDLSIDKDPREGVYKIRDIRNTQNTYDFTSRTTGAAGTDLSARSNQRLRGNYSTCIIKWPVVGAKNRTLSSVVTKYRLSRGYV
jgi:hypothetical protein